MAARPDKLDAKKFKTLLLPKIKQAGKTATKAVIQWAEISAITVKGAKSHADWHWLLHDMQEMAWEAREECNYTVNYLVQLAETYHAVQGDFDRGVPISILVEGRNLPNLLDIIENEPDITVPRMKAHVYKATHKHDERSVDEIEADQKDKREKQREGVKEAKETDEIVRLADTDVDALVLRYKRIIRAYEDAFSNVEAEGGVVKAGDLKVAVRATKNVLDALMNISTEIEEEDYEDEDEADAA